MIKSKQLNKPQLVLIVDDQEINRDVLGMILALLFTRPQKVEPSRPRRILRAKSS